MADVDERYERYIPKDMREHLVWLERVDNECDRSHVYFVTFEYDGKEYSLEPCDTVDEIRWYSKQLKEQLSMPDSDITIHQMKWVYGYMNDDVILPVGREKAIEYFNEAQIYKLYPDNTEAAVETIDEIRNDKPGTLWGIEREDWEILREKIKNNIPKEAVTNEEPISKEELKGFQKEIENKKEKVI